MEYLEFIETPTFSRKCKELLTDDEYRQLQEYLTHYPDAGALIVELEAAGKLGGVFRDLARSGIRAIYYYLCADGQIFMLLVYPKSEKDSLTENEKSIIKNIVQSLS